MTQFADKCGILGQLWADYRDDEDFKAFIDYNDLGLPLAYFIAEGMVHETPLAEQYVDETWNLFIQSIDLTEQEIGEIDNLNDLLDAALMKKNNKQE